jgi:hypothetical protein
MQIEISGYQDNRVPAIREYQQRRCNTPDTLITWYPFPDLLIAWYPIIGFRPFAWLYDLIDFLVACRIDSIHEGDPE